MSELKQCPECVDCMGAYSELIARQEKRIVELNGAVCERDGRIGSYERRNTELNDALKAICKQFGVSTEWSAEDTAKKVLEALERDYMALPHDADGVPIHVGDELEAAHCGKVIVEYVGECEVRVYRDGEHYRISQDEYAYTCRHIKPRTVEDILALFLTAVGDDDPHYYDEQIAEYAAEIREMMEAGA